MTAYKGDRIEKKPSWVHFLVHFIGGVLLVIFGGIVISAGNDIWGLGDTRENAIGAIAMFVIAAGILAIGLVIAFKYSTEE